MISTVVLLLVITVIVCALIVKHAESKADDSRASVARVLDILDGVETRLASLERDSERTSEGLSKLNQKVVSLSQYKTDKALISPELSGSFALSNITDNEVVLRPTKKTTKTLKKVLSNSGKTLSQALASKRKKK